MEPGARGRSPVSARVAQRVAGDAVICIPYRPRKGAGYSRKIAAADPDATTAPRQDSEPDSNAKASAPADALSLSGTTPPSSPTMSGFPCGTKIITPEPTRSQLALVDSQGNVVAKDEDEAPAKDVSFRKHTRGIGSIDSILSSTTCVNTHSECSRAGSRLSREIRVEIEDVDSGCVPTLSYHLVPGEKNRIQPVKPSNSEPRPALACGDYENQEALDDEAGLVDEISSLVLREAFGKDLDECAAPLLIGDCTYRYIQELWLAAHYGKLGYNQTASAHGTPSSHGAGTPGPGNNDQQHPDHYGKGKRKAGGDSEDGSGSGGRDHQGDDQRDVSPASQAYSSKGSSISNFSCPYRKRNPLRFNVRDHFVCATHSFSDMSQLKKHIRAHHPPVQRNAGPFSCPRCCQGFVSKTDLDSHLRRLEVCRLSDDTGGADPEDGITQKIISSLEARSLKAKIDNWVSLWKLLFPGDEIVPDPFFVPVMEVFDFIAESKKFLSTLRDLLEIQYRHVLEGAGQALDVDLKIRQGLERSVQSIYNWVETVVQDWEQRIAGTVSIFTSSAVGQTATTDSFASTPQLPPSPASTPTVASGTGVGTSTLPAAESPGSTAPAAVRGALARRRPNPPPKRVKMPEILPKIQPATQIPVPVQRARTPQPQTRTIGDSFRPPPTVLPSQSIRSSNLDSRTPYHASWEDPTVPGQSAYSVPYTSPGDVFQHSALAPTHYASTYPRQLNVQPYLGQEQPLDAVPTETLQHDVHSNPQSASVLRASQLISSSTPRSSLASLTWIRDENRDSSQTLVEAHPPGRCRDMYCPSCNKTLPEDMAAAQSPAQAGMHPAAAGAPPHLHHLHRAFETSGVGSDPPFQAASSQPGEVHHFADQVEWEFHSHGVTGNDNMFGGGHGPQEGY
ncbi:hypothetical protein VTK56DRAFT_4437 [Thermocarpiscus australiensis]